MEIFVENYIQGAKETLLGKVKVLNKDVKIVGVVDGDPFDYRTWSGSSRFLFRALQAAGYLKAAVSGLPHPLVNYYFKLTSIQTSLPKWKFRWHINTRYYEAMTKRAEKALGKIRGSYNHVMQIAAWFNIPSFVSGKGITTSTYQDANLALLLKSPFGYPRISEHLIKRALEWENNVYHRLDLIFTMSEWLRQSFIKDIGVSAEKVHNVGAGINLEKMPTLKEKCYDGKNILFVGIDFERKGGKYLLEAFEKVRKEFKDASLTIIGKRLCNVPRGVECLGFVSKSTAEGQRIISEAYEKASIFVMPSLFEPLGIVFLEAMAYRLPCIGTNHCAIPEIIDHGKTGYTISVGDSDALASCIVDLFRNPTMMEEMGQNGYIKVREQFTWSKVAEKIVKVISVL